MRQIVYLSIAATDLMRSDWHSILQVSQRLNKDVAITGLLLFDGAQFMQALEGPEAEVTRTMSRINQDTRHRPAGVLRSARIRAREFGMTPMHGRFVSTKEEAYELAHDMFSMTESTSSAKVRAAFIGFASLARMAFDSPTGW